MNGNGRKPIRVVVADDDAAYADSLRELIESQPELEVVGTAADGGQAIDLVEALEPEAVVLDLRMPVLDGVEAVRRLRADHPTLCLIALTGADDPALHSAAEEAGADAVLHKRDMLDGLLERLAAA